jgi:hypothetical protein
MTADLTRTLSSVDLLDEGEHARLDAIGNRAALTQPVSIPVLFAARGGLDTGCGGVAAAWCA